MDEGFWTAVAAGIAAVALGLSIVNFFQSREYRVGWTAQRSQVRESAHNYRLRNDSRTFRAQVTNVDSNYVGDSSDRKVRDLPTLPAVIEPGNWLPLVAFQILDQEPVAITVHWKQARIGSDRFRKREYSTTVYL